MRLLITLIILSSSLCLALPEDVPGNPDAVVSAPAVQSGGFFEWFLEATTTLDGILWGMPMIILLIGTGIVLTIMTRGIQFTRQQSVLTGRNPASSDVSTGVGAPGSDRV